jgi:hypothetical protein
MGDERGDTRPRSARDAVTRRDFLRKAAAAGTGAFAVPMIITVDPADAQALTSPPPQPPGSTGPGSRSVEPVGSRGTPGPGTRGTQPADRRQVSGRSELPRTGAAIDRMVATGLAATAGGAALVLWSADMRSKSAAPRPAEPEPEA